MMSVVVLMHLEYVVWILFNIKGNYHWQMTGIVHAVCVVDTIKVLIKDYCHQ